MIISIIIPCFNEKNTILDILDRIKNQSTFKKDKFILILLFTLSSLHHKYSFLAYFNLENYWQVIFTLPIIIYLFYIFFLRKISL